MSKLIEIMRSLKSKDGYYNVTNPIFNGFKELLIISAAKQCGYTVRWSDCEQCMIVIPN